MFTYYLPKKPAGRVAEMEVVKHTVRTKTATDPLTGKVVASVQTGTLRYPENHPRSLYKKAKRKFKEART